VAIRIEGHAAKASNPGVGGSRPAAGATWAGTQWLSPDAPEGCVPQGCATCFVEQPVARGTAYCDGSDTAAHVGGWCWIPDGAPRTDLERSVVFDYPTTTHVEIVFD
jgi:hypothetical protein